MLECFNPASCDTSATHPITGIVMGTIFAFIYWPFLNIFTKYSIRLCADFAILQKVSYGQILLTTTPLFVNIIPVSDNHSGGNQVGHYWREMDPAGAAAHDRRIDRLLKLRKKLENMPLSSFIVADFGSLYRVMGVDIHKDAREEDLARLEQKVRKVAKKS